MNAVDRITPGKQTRVFWQHTRAPPESWRTFLTPDQCYDLCNQRLRLIFGICIVKRWPLLHGAHSEHSDTSRWFHIRSTGAALPPCCWHAEPHLTHANFHSILIAVLQWP